MKKNLKKVFLLTMIIAMLISIYSNSTVAAQADNDIPTYGTRAAVCPPHYWRYHYCGANQHYLECTVCYTVGTIEGCEQSYIVYQNYDGHQFFCNKCWCSGSLLPHNTQNTPYYQDSEGLGHYQFCQDCSYPTEVELHTFVFVDYDDDMHLLKCYDCGYSTGSTAPHTYIYESVGTNGHRLKCTGCSHTEATLPHNLTYVSDGLDYHHTKCTTCTYKTALVAHIWNGIIVNIPVPHQHCTLCGQDSCFHSDVTAVPKSATLHLLDCSECGMRLGTESHLFDPDGMCVQCGFHI